MYVHAYVCICICVSMHVNAVPMEVRRGHWTSWS